MEISISLQLPVPAARPGMPASSPVDPEETVRTEEAERERSCRCEHRRPRHGRRHVQRAARHLLRDIRHDIRSEIKELHAGGDREKIEAVKGAYHDFRDEVRNVLKGAGRGRHFDREAVVQGLGAAMAAFTAALRELNGTTEEPPADTPPSPEKNPTPDVAMPPGALLDIGA
jgi:hypothetical protein